MKLIKYILSLTAIVILTSCSSTAPQQVKFDSESYDWKKWDCYEYGYGGKYLLTIGYIPELFENGFYEGKLFLKDATAPIHIIYELKGVQHNWQWDEFRIVIDSDGTGRYWDFTNTDVGEEVMSKEHYECTSSDLEKFNQFMESIW
jgi:hypothetical protein